MAIEGGHASEYDPLLQPKLRAEAVRVIRSFSFAGAHVVIVGGLAPSLLVPRPEEGIEGPVDAIDHLAEVAVVARDLGAGRELPLDAAASQGVHVGHEGVDRVDAAVDVVAERLELAVPQVQIPRGDAV